MIRKIASALAALAGSLLFTAADAAGPGHDHGKADMAFGLEGQDLTVSFIADLADLVGFERLPQTTEEEQALEELKAQLAQPATIIQLPANTGCELQSADISGMPDASAAEKQGDHFRITVIHMLSCASPGRLREVTVTAFDSFPALEKINAVSFMESGQRGDILTPASQTFRLK
ncbi:MAG: DUF2796 domain-containing protein [Pseudomonadota bacterium]